METYSQMAAYIWALAQVSPWEGMIDAIERIEDALNEFFGKENNPPISDMEKRLLKIRRDILLDCPVSPYLEDMNIPCKISKTNARYIQGKLYELDNWLKNIHYRLKPLQDMLKTQRHNKED